MKFSIIICFLYCSCSHTGRNWYITEINKVNKNECLEIIRERPCQNKLFKRVIYKIKEDCQDNKKK